MKTWIQCCLQNNGRVDSNLDFLKLEKEVTYVTPESRSPYAYMTGETLITQCTEGRLELVSSEQHTKKTGKHRR
jgi:hypothetical protein